jgi:hypothetical protein
MEALSSGKVDNSLPDFTASCPQKIVIFIVTALRTGAFKVSLVKHR